MNIFLKQKSLFSLNKSRKQLEPAAEVYIEAASVPIFAWHI